jgi:hypothetical protein
MKWTVILHDEFEAELLALDADFRVGIAARAKLLAEHGPQLGRPYVDTLTGSRHVNMKELRFDAGNGVWRVAFAFDPVRQAVLLVAGDKAGANQKRFYEQLIRVADKRFSGWLEPKKRG